MCAGVQRVDSKQADMLEYARTMPRVPHKSYGAASILREEDDRSDTLEVTDEDRRRVSAGRHLAAVGDMGQEIWRDAREDESTMVNTPANVGLVSTGSLEGSAQQNEGDAAGQGSGAAWTIPVRDKRLKGVYPGSGLRLPKCPYTLHHVDSPVLAGRSRLHIHRCPAFVPRDLCHILWER